MGRLQLEPGRLGRSESLKVDDGACVAPPCVCDRDSQAFPFGNIMSQTWTSPLGQGFLQVLASLYALQMFLPAAVERAVLYWDPNFCAFGTRSTGGTSMRANVPGGGAGAEGLAWSFPFLFLPRPLPPPPPPPPPPPLPLPLLAPFPRVGLGCQATGSLSQRAAQNDDRLAWILPREPIVLRSCLAHSPRIVSSIVLNLTKTTLSAWLWGACM